MHRHAGLLSTLAATAALAACADTSPIMPQEHRTAESASGTPFDASAAPLDVAVIGDVPYGAAATALYPDLIAAINGDPKVRRVVHVGDIKSGSTLCSDAWFASIRESFDAFEDPLIYTPGDNEWTDCHRLNNGGYDPLERLDRIRTVFFDEPGTTMGRRTRRVESQDGYPENQLWVESRVVFVAIHAVGSNNNLAPWTNETPAQTVAKEAEVAARDAANRAWLARAFDLAEARDAAGMVIFAHGDMWHPADVAAGVDFSGHQAFVELLAARALAFGRPIVLVAGDSHAYRVDRPLVNDANYGIPFDVPNLTQVTVEESIRDGRIVWVRLHIDPRTADVITWEEVEVN